MDGDPLPAPAGTPGTMLTRFLRIQLGKVHHRLFLLEEYLHGCRGRPMPPHLMRQIMRRPADAEDWIHLLRFVGPEEPVFLVDVGACVGDFTHGFLACYQDAEVVALEPASATFDQLRTRFAAHPAVTCLRHAADARDGDMVMQVYPDQPTMNTLHRYVKGTQPAFDAGTARRENITCRTLPSAVTLPSDRTVVVKIDVQGHENAVIEGGGDWFAGVDAVLCEVSFCPEYVGLAPSFAGVASRLAAHDLHPVVLQTYGQTISNYAVERDVLFVKRSRLDRILLVNY